jgi:hypothetical protein
MCIRVNVETAAHVGSSELFTQDVRDWGEDINPTYFAIGNSGEVYFDGFDESRGDTDFGDGTGYVRLTKNYTVVNREEAQELVGRLQKFLALKA